MYPNFLSFQVAEQLYNRFLNLFAYTALLNCITFYLIVAMTKLIILAVAVVACVSADYQQPAYKAPVQTHYQAPAPVYHPTPTPAKQYYNGEYILSITLILNNNYVFCQLHWVELIFYRLMKMKYSLTIDNIIL